MRNAGWVGFFERSAFFSYLAFLMAMTFYLWGTKAAQSKTWLSLFSGALVFGVLGFLSEYLLYFNAHESEKEEGSVIFVACFVGALMFGLLTSFGFCCDWLVIRLKRARSRSAL
jgi:hypothetical protein